MEPVLQLFVPLLLPALLGGLGLAGAILLWPRRARRRDAAVTTRSTPLSVDAINMAHIRVDGVGGLGLVAMAIGIAVAVPRIGQTVALGLVLGAALAAVWILRRRETGPMPSSGQGRGAHTLFVIDARDRERDNGSPDDRLEIQDLVAHPAGSRL